MNDVPPFDPNDYRKRVLAAVERRGGPDTSDPFELYDLPLTELDDATVEATLGTVVKYREDQRRVRDHGVDELIQQALLRGV